MQLLTEKHDVVQRQSGFCHVLFAFVQLKLMAFWNSDAVYVFFCRQLLPSWDSRYSMLAKLLDDLSKFWLLQFLLPAGNTDVNNINGTVTADSCASSGALSASSLSAFVPLLVASVAVVYGVLYY